MYSRWYTLKVYPQHRICQHVCALQQGNIVHFNQSRKVLCSGAVLNEMQSVVALLFAMEIRGYLRKYGFSMFFEIIYSVKII